MTGIFFPQRESLRLDSQNVTPKAREKAVWAGGCHKSFDQAAKALEKLAELKLSGRQIHRLTRQAGQEMIEQRDRQVEACQHAKATRPLTDKQPPAAKTANPPDVVAVEMDGGRFRARQEGGGHGVIDPHWREMKVGCLLRLKSETHKEDPHPQVPKCFLDRPRVQKLVRQLDSHKASTDNSDSVEIDKLVNDTEFGPAAGTAGGQTGDSQCKPLESPQSSSSNTQSWRPHRLVRTCVATEHDSQAFGHMLATEAEQRDFDHASRKAFLGDGQACNWTIQATHFSNYVPIVDFVHLVSYVYAFAMCAASTQDAGWNSYVSWITSIWLGHGESVLRQWRTIAQDLGVPETALPDNDPLRPIQRGVTYLSNNLSRIDYPRYRRDGLPVTSTLVESLIKEFNYRVKGTEKFWDDPSGSESILAVRSSLLSEDDRFSSFFTTRPGCRYRRRSTWEKLHGHPPLANSA